MKIDQNLKKISISRLFLILILGLLVAVVSCSEADRGVTKTGSFVDSEVEGIEYTSADGSGETTFSGVTDENGSFNYYEGDTVTFNIGGIVIGSATAEPVITPVDLVDGAADETDSTVTNIAKLLQTLDDNDNPEDGISITDAVRTSAVEMSIDFSLSVAQFQVDTKV